MKIARYECSNVDMGEFREARKQLSVLWFYTTWKTQYCSYFGSTYRGSYFCIDYNELKSLQFFIVLLFGFYFVISYSYAHFSFIIRDTACETTYPKHCLSNQLVLKVNSWNFYLICQPKYNVILNATLLINTMNVISME